MGDGLSWFASRVALHAEAMLLLILARIGLWTAKTETVRRRLAPKPRPMADNGAVALQVARAVRRMARLVPRASCLTQAIAGQVMMARRGVPSVIRIGVAIGEVKGFEAHAWVVAARRVVIGDDATGLERFSGITEFAYPPAS